MTRQRNIFLALMDNFNQKTEDGISVQQLLEEQMKSSGLASQRYEIYLDNLEAAQNRAITAWQTMWETTIKSDWVKSFYDGSAAVMDLVTELGGLQTILLTLIPIMMAFNAARIEGAVSGMTVWIKDAWIGIKNLIPALRTATVAQSGFNLAAMSNPYVWIPLAVAGLILLANAIPTPMERLQDLNSEFKETQEEIKKVSIKAKEISELSDSFKSLKAAGSTSQEFYDVQNKLKELMPELIGYYDSYGNFIITDTKAMEKLTNATQAQIEAQEGLDKLKKDAEKTSQEGASLLSYLYKQTQGTGYHGYAGTQKEGFQKKAVEDYQEALSLEKERFQLLGKEAQDEYIKGLTTLPELQSVFVKYQKEIFEAQRRAAEIAKTEQILGEKGIESLPQPMTIGGEDFSKRVENLSELSDGFTKLYEAQEKYGASSVETFKALQDFIGESKNATDYLLEDGSVNFEKLREEQNKYLDDLIANIDTLEGVTEAEKNAIRSMVEEVRKSVRTFDVLGYQVSQSTFLEFGDALANEMWSAVDEMGQASITIGNQTLSSASQIFSYIQQYPEQLVEVIRAFVNISGQGASAFVQQWSSALGAMTGSVAMPDMYSTLGISKPVGGGGGGGGGSRDTTNQDRLDKEISALEERKSALEDNADEFKKYIELQKESLRLQKEEKEFADEIMEKNKSLAKLRTEISLLSLDDSAEARAKRLELEEQASELEQEIAKETEDRTYELQIDALDRSLAEYEENIQQQMDILDSKISLINEEREAIDEVGASLGGVSGAMQSLGAITAQQGQIITAKFSEMFNLSDRNKTKLQEQIDKWVDIGLSIEDAYIRAWEYAQLLANMPSNFIGIGSDGEEVYRGSKNAAGGHHEVRHQGGFIGNLKSNEAFAKLLKGEYVATEGQMQNFMGNVLPKIAGNPTFSANGGSVEINIPIHVAGSLDKTVLPDIEKIANKVLEEINKAMRQRGYIRQTTLTSI